jgi:hypothetical protein
VWRVLEERRRDLPRGRGRWRSCLDDGSRRDGRGPFGSSCLGRAGDGPETSPRVPDPLGEDLPELLTPRRLTDEAIRGLLLVLFEEGPLEAAPGVEETEEVGGRESAQGGQGGNEELRCTAP